MKDQQDFAATGVAAARFRFTCVQSVPPSRGVCSPVVSVVSSRLTRTGVSNWVAVGTPVTRRPPRGSVREELPHTALTLGNDDQYSGGISALLLLVRPTIRCLAFPARSPARVRFLWRFPWSIPFPPRAPQPPSGRPCSPLSSVLWDRPTPWKRTCPTYGSAFSDRPPPNGEGVSRVSRFPCNEFPRMRRVFDSAASKGGLRLASPLMLPSPHKYKVGTPKW